MIMHFPGPSVLLSVCMIVKNEAHQMAEALAGFQSFADEIVVVDTGSTDGTKSVSRQFTPTIFDFPWIDDFAAARNFSMEKARGRYVLWLDADDRLQPVMQQHIRSLKSYFDGNQAFYLVLQNVDVTGPSWSCLQLRCVPRRPEIRFEGRVHEQLHPSIERVGIPAVRTDIVIQHFGYTERGQFLQKIRRNLAILEKERADGRNDEQIHYYLALAHETLGRYGDAIAAMHAALVQLERRVHERPAATAPPMLESVTEGHLFLARNYLRQGATSSALRHLLKARATADEDANVCYRLGCLFQKLGRHQQALACFQQALTAESRVRFHPAEPTPAESDILVHVALSRFSLGKGTEAEEAIRRRDSLGFSRRESLERVGLMALQNREWELSLRAYQGAQQLGLLSPDSNSNLGLLYDKRGDTRKALECYSAALRGMPVHPVALANQSHLYFRLGDLRNARRGFEILIQNQQAELDFLLPLALIALKEGDRLRFGQTVQMLVDQLSPPSSLPPENHLALFQWVSATLADQHKPRLAGWAKAVADELAAL